MSHFLRNLNEHRALFAQLDALDGVIADAGDLIAASLKSGGKVMFCGNGGSAADSQHMAAELTGRLVQDRAPIAALALTTDTSALTAIGNDTAFADIFSRQVQALGRAGDCLVGISTSGNSDNVVRAFDMARAAGIATLGLLGRDGGRLKALSDVAIMVPSDVTARVQEAHILIGHSLCGMAERALGLVGE